MCVHTEMLHGHLYGTDLRVSTNRVVSTSTLPVCHRTNSRYHFSELRTSEDLLSWSYKVDHLLRPHSFRALQRLLIIRHTYKSFCFYCNGQIEDSEGRKVDGVGVIERRKVTSCLKEIHLVLRRWKSRKLKSPVLTTPYKRRTTDSSLSLSCNLKSPFIKKTLVS